MSYQSNTTVLICMYVDGFDAENATFKKVMAERVARLRGMKNRYTVWSNVHGDYVEVYIGVRDWKTGEEVSIFHVTAKQVSLRLRKYGIVWEKRPRQW